MKIIYKLQCSNNDDDDDDDDKNTYLIMPFELY